MAFGLGKIWNDDEADKALNRERRRKEIDEQPEASGDSLFENGRLPFDVEDDLHDEAMGAREVVSEMAFGGPFDFFSNYVNDVRSLRPLPRFETVMLSLDVNEIRRAEYQGMLQGLAEKAAQKDVEKDSGAGLAAA